MLEALSQQPSKAQQFLRAPGLSSIMVLSAQGLSASGMASALQGAELCAQMWFCCHLQF